MKVAKLLANISIVLGFLFLLAPLGYLAALSTPDIWYRINPQALEAEVEALSREPFSSEAVQLPDINAYPPIASLPELKPELGTTPKLIVPSIGIDTQIYPDYNERIALEKGVWLMSQYATPELNTNKPIILAAHRWGRISLSREFRRQNLFYNLPNLKVGEEVSIIWQSREYKYRVSYKEESQNVTRLSDLILITCQFVNSPYRIIVYAERIQ